MNAFLVPGNSGRGRRSLFKAVGEAAGWLAAEGDEAPSRVRRIGPSLAFFLSNLLMEAQHESERKDRIECSGARSSSPV